jgi:hypothetical protein
MKRLLRDILVSLIAISLLLGSCVSDEKTQGRTQSPESRPSPAGPPSSGRTQSPEQVSTDNVRVRGKAQCQITEVDWPFVQVKITNLSNFPASIRCWVLHATTGTWREMNVFLRAKGSDRFPGDSIVKYMGPFCGESAGSLISAHHIEYWRVR